jgi:outer membrane protein TolC
MSFRQVYIALILSASFFQLNGQDDNDTLILSLSDAQDYALEFNRTVQAAKIDVSAAEKRVWEVLATGFPQINFAANYLHQFSVPELSFGPVLNIDNLPDVGFLTKSDVEDAFEDSPAIPLGVANNTTLDITLSQLLFSGEYLVGLQATRVLKKTTELNVIRTEDQIEEAVATTYYMVLVLDESAKVLKESLKSTQQIYEELLKMNQEGFNEDTDVDQMKISVSNIEILLNSLAAQKDVTMKLLKFQLGIEFDRSVVLTDSLANIILRVNAEYQATPAFQVESNIDYQMVINREQIQALLLKREQSRLFPTVSGFYRHQEQTNAPSFNFAVKDVAGVTLTFPIITSGQRLATISQAKFNLQKSRMQTADVEQNLIMEYETARSNYETAYGNYIANEESLVLSRKVYDRTVVKFKEGVSTSFELSQNQTQFLTAETRYYNSLLTFLNAKARLDRILTGSN